jgi:TonB family protein
MGAKLVRVTICYRLMFLSFLLMTRVSGANQRIPEWQRYTVKGEGFSVLFPEMPAMTTAMGGRQVVDPERRERVLGAYSNGVVYAIYSFGNRNFSESLESFINEMATSRLPPGGTLHFQRDLSSDGLSGKEYTFTVKGVSGLVRFYPSGQHLYAFEAIGANPTNPDVAKYFSSIDFGKTASGIEVKDGPGPNRPDGELDQSLKGKDVDRRAVVVTKPEPSYTALAQNNHVSGAVVLRAVFSSSGRITKVATVKGLPDGLTERAIEAARQIRFVPAIKDGRFVSTWIDLEYNFLVP